MSCFSRLLGLICAVVPGLLFLAFSVLFFARWPQLGYLTGPLYSLASFVTGAVCLYLGISILFGRDHIEESAVAPLEVPATAQPMIEAKPLQAAPLPTEVIETPRVQVATPSRSALTSTETVPISTPPDSPETRIRQLASTRPNWQVTAPQLAHIANLNMAIADATAREMAGNGQARMQIGPNGETIYIFDLANQTN